NPTLSDLVGGIQAVTLSDEEAKRRGTQKTVLERKSPPTFDIVIEIMEQDKMAIHHDVATTVDRMLRGVPPRPEMRERAPDGQIEVIQLPDEAEGGIGGPTRGGGLDGGAPAGLLTETGRSRGGSLAPGMGIERASPTRYERERAETPPRNAPATGRSGSQTVRIYPYGVS